MSRRGRTLSDALADLPDLSNKIVKSNDHYCGAGAFSDVYKRQYDSDAGPVEVAVKSFRFLFTLRGTESEGNESRGTNDIRKMIRRELGIWRRLEHPNIVPFLGITYGFGGQGHASLVSLWMANGSLQNFLQKLDDQLTTTYRLQLLLDIAKGLCYLHSFQTPIIHGDLSCNNVLLDHNFKARLTDFGYASMVGDIPEALSYLQMSTTRPGTVRWAAPEHFAVDEEEAAQSTTKSDIYSFGNLGLLVLSGKQPWSDVRRDEAVMVQLSQGRKPKRPLSRPIDDEHWGLIDRCWSSIDDRPLTRDVVSFLQQFLHSSPPCLPLVDVLRDLSRSSTASPQHTPVEPAVHRLAEQETGIILEPREQTLDLPDITPVPVHDVTIEHARPVLPSRYAKPIAPDVSLSHLPGTSAETSSPDIITPDVFPRPGNVAALRDRFLVSKPHPHDDSLSSHGKPSTLVSSPQTLRVQHPQPRPSRSSLLAEEDSLELASSSNSSLRSPFPDDESEASENPETCLSPTVQLSGSGEFASTGYIHHNNQKHPISSNDGLSGFFLSKPKPPPRPSSHSSSRPPRRQNGLSVPTPHESPPTGSATTTPKQFITPLPSHQAAQGKNGAGVLPSVPPLPSRPLSLQGVASIEGALPVGERKPLGSAKSPPPLIRTIGLGDKLPPGHRTHALSSDEESVSEGDLRVRSVESLPDSSRSSRRPPSLHCAGFLEYKIHVPAHSGHVAATGTGVVVASGHHIKYHHLSSDGGSSWSLDTRDGMRGCLVSCVEFRPAHNSADGGKYLWVGTKEGHLLEVDLATGAFTSSKRGIHASQVTNIFRHGSTMITVDEAGKALIFDTNVDAGVGAGAAGGVNLVYTTARVHHLGEKVEFVKLLGGLLWAAMRTEVSGAGTASHPVIRIHDICAPGSIDHAVTPNHHAGAVTSGTILPSHPDHVYLGHEGGYISVWNIATDDRIPACVEVAKVSASDVLCLEGVNGRLWVGGRKGTISAYDVSTKPWVTTNCWDAHSGLPVLRIFVDPYALEHMEKLVVVSVGRDEQVKFWDGFLGADRIEQELLKREHAFSTFRDLKVLIVSWNINAAKPESLIGDPENVAFLHDVLTSVDSPDIISFGFQEVIHFEFRKIAAKTVLLGTTKRGEGKVEKVTSSYKRWYDLLIQAVMLAMPPESSYTAIHTESLLGLFTCVFVKKTVNNSVRDPAIATIKRGMGARYGNKGGIVARFVIDDSSLCFINCHLAAGQHHVRQRNADVVAILETTNVFPVERVEEYRYVGGGDGSMVLDHEIVFLNGDMNYRIDQRRGAVLAAVEANDLGAILMHDQLRKEMNYNRAFRLRTFHEGALTFAPTYKYDRNSSMYDTSEKYRVPAWCDRVLWRSRDEERVALMDYRRWEVNVSDHRPVSAVFRVTVKKVVEEAREKEKRVVETWWNGREGVLLAKAKAFYGV